jgi:hypothetical protein
VNKPEREKKHDMQHNVQHGSDMVGVVDVQHAKGASSEEERDYY